MILIISYRTTQKSEEIVFSIAINNNILVEKSLDGQSHQFIYDFEDSDEFRLIKITMSMQGKTQKHTVVDEHGNIILDSAVVIDSILIDDIDVTEIFCRGLPCYEHNNNGSSSKFVDEFYGYIGCNGKISIEFSVPLYKWFLKYCK